MFETAISLLQIANFPYKKYSVLNVACGGFDFVTFALLAYSLVSVITGIELRELSVTALEPLECLLLVLFRTAFIYWVRAVTFSACADAAVCLDVKIAKSIWQAGPFISTKLDFSKDYRSGWHFYNPGSFSLIFGLSYDIGVLIASVTTVLLTTTVQQGALGVGLLVCIYGLIYTWNKQNSKRRKSRVGAENARLEAINIVTDFRFWGASLLNFNTILEALMIRSNALFTNYFQFELVKRSYRLLLESIMVILTVSIIYIGNDEFFFLALLSLRILPSMAGVYSQLRSLSYFSENIIEICRLTRIKSLTAEEFENRHYRDECEKFLLSGDNVAILNGPSGSGKSVCLKSLVWEMNVSNQIAYVPQIPLESTLTLDNMIEILSSDEGWSIQSASEGFKELDLSLHELRDKSFCQMSGGERIRVFLSIFAISKFEILALDEPTAGLDARSAELVLQMILEVSKTKRLIISSHDRRFETWFPESRWIS